MKKPYIRPFVVFSILAFVMFVALAALLVVYPFLFIQGNFAFLPTFFKQIYFSLPVLHSFVDFSGGIIPKIATLAVVGILAVLFVVMLILAIAKIHKKVGAKIVGILVAVFGLAVAYFGGLISVASVYTTAPIYAATSFTGAVASWEGWIGAIQLIKGGLNGLEPILKLVFQIALPLVTLLFAVFGVLAIVKGIQYARAASVQDEEVVPEELPEPVEEPEVKEEPVEAVPEELPVFMPEPEDEVVDPQNLSTTALAAIIKDVVREIVRD